MKGLPVTIRLLDPPLHEFLPSSEEDIKKVAKDRQVDPKKIKDKVNFLHEFNPMLGHRGCRLGITFPEIYKMQVRAIFEAACEIKKEGENIIPEVMIPLVGHINELKMTKADLIKEAEKVISENAVDLEYKVGTMIEVPRACLTAYDIAKEADFFSFGTNDLTQMTFGFSRDDIAKFLPYYLEKGILEKDPFMVLDQEGVGQLVKMAASKGREAKPDLKVGICGEHGGEPSSVAFCHKVGLNYVSCSPFRVPVARLAAAQTVIEEEKDDKKTGEKINA
jgi:pyruvate,orthophosphate dikinase